MRDKTEIAAPFLPYRQAMTEAVVRLCRIPSVKAPAEPGGPFGAANAAVLAEFLQLGRELGFKAVDLDGYCGYLEWGADGPITAILGHLDVVPAIDGWTHDPFTPLITEDRIIARGTADDKGPVVAALFALKALKDEGFVPRGRIRLIVGLDEESGSECMAHYVRVAELPVQGFTPDANFPVIYAEKGIAHLVLSGQPAGDSSLAASETTGKGRAPQASRRLISAHAGQRANMVPAKCELTWQDADGQLMSETFTGKAAHASTPWEGENAILNALRQCSGQVDPDAFIAACATVLGAAEPGTAWRGDSLQISGADHSGPLTVNPGILRVDAQTAQLTLDIRYPATWSFDQLLKDLQRVTAPHGLTVAVQHHQAPLVNDPEAPLVQALMRVYNTVCGDTAQAIAIGGGTYARTMPNIVAFGPSFADDPDVCHQVDEYITFDKLLASATVYREALRALAGCCS